MEVLLLQFQWEFWSFLGGVVSWGFVSRVSMKREFRLLGEFSTELIDKRSLFLYGSARTE